MPEEFDTSGTWHSKYRYPSSSRKGIFTGEHDVTLLRTGNLVMIHSLPDESGSYILLRLVKDGPALTGTWHEYTSPEGHYEGKIYYGGIQLMLDNDSHVMRGMWVGHTRDMTVETGEWEIARTRSR